MWSLLLIFFWGWRVGAEPARGQYALLIGITGYPKYSSEERLNFADDDAQAFSEFLTSPEGGGFARENMQLLLNEDATRDNIYGERGLQWLSQRSSGSDTVYVYFAGHSTVDDSTGEVFLMPFNAAPRSPLAQGIRARDFFQDFDTRVQARNLVFFIDACHSGASLNGGMVRGPVDAAASIRKIWNEVFSERKEGRMAFVSATSGQKSYEDAKLKHGLFTWYLLKGLKGDAVRKGGRITMGGVVQYVVQKVEEHSQREFRSRQTPFPSPNYDPDFVLAVFGKTPAPAGEAVRPEASSSEAAAKEGPKSYEGACELFSTKSVDSPRQLLVTRRRYEDARIQWRAIVVGTRVITSSVFANIEVRACPKGLIDKKCPVKEYDITFEPEYEDRLLELEPGEVIDFRGNLRMLAFVWDGLGCYAFYVSSAELL